MHRTGLYALAAHAGVLHGKGNQDVIDLLPNTIKFIGPAAIQRRVVEVLLKAGLDKVLMNVVQTADAMKSRLYPVIVQIPGHDHQLALLDLRQEVTADDGRLGDPLLILLVTIPLRAKMKNVEQKLLPISVHRHAHAFADSRIVLGLRVIGLPDVELPSEDLQQYVAQRESGEESHMLSRGVVRGPAHGSIGIRQTQRAHFRLKLLHVSIITHLGERDDIGVDPMDDLGYLLCRLVKLLVPEAVLILLLLGS